MKLHLKGLRIAFFGTSDFAAYHLFVLIHCSIHKIVAIFTQESIKIKQKSSILSIHTISQINNILLFQSYFLSQSQINHIIKNLNIDIIIVVSYGVILSQEILHIPKLGCINIHGSLLPRWRGPAPIQRALEHGDTMTGISIIQMNSNIDTGDILHSTPCKISPKDTSYTLSKKLACIGSIALLKTIEKIILGTCKNIPQDTSNITYAYKLNKKEAHINWNKSAIEIERRIRAFNPWPVSYFKIKNQYIRVWNAEINKNSINTDQYNDFQPGTILKTHPNGIYVITGSGIIILTVLQISGKKKIHVKDLMNAYSSLFTMHSVLT
ncbi:methionyl-tRNA formyltransferase [Candidatus Blochmanniella floridana]|uniref:Methionyl-tRNA formyltransferase n=1 Tax=Blochmanniella floridana TaxID=203907 RepID=FMT_BLOFL|nr:RecName: Full=Methionyl-tRNA formyltransferase [Candidatus Blochmannia floridanus]CAD83733.1 methionyl-tRNA formyltransferase [Candidatus Blochmannia floridanus]